MSISKKIRQQLYDKYNGRCGYTGQLLEQDWQVDHITPQCHWKWFQPAETCSVDDIENLIPCLRIINHYKRGKDLEMWRTFMLSFHSRLKKLPKNTKVLETQKRKDYLLKVAEHFNITVDKPFDGLFYFEKIICPENKRA